MGLDRGTILTKPALSDDKACGLELSHRAGLALDVVPARLELLAQSWFQPLDSSGHRISKSSQAWVSAKVGMHENPDVELLHGLRASRQLVVCKHASEGRDSHSLGTSRLRSNPSGMTAPTGNSENSGPCGYPDWGAPILLPIHRPTEESA